MENVELARRRRQTAEEDAGSGTDVNAIDSETLANRYQDSKNRLGKNHPDTVQLAHALAGRFADTASHKRRMISHLRGKHKRNGQFESMAISDLHRQHENDHNYGGVTPHSHEPDIAPRDQRFTELACANGEADRFDAWGDRVDLATKVVDYGNGTRVVHHSEGKPTVSKRRTKRPSYAKGNYVGFAGLVKRIVAQGKSEDEAKAIAAAIGRNKYGAKKFAAMRKGSK